MDGVEKEINDESKIRVFDCSWLNKLAIYTHSTKKRALRASALRADGVPLRVDF